MDNVYDDVVIEDIEEDQEKPGFWKRVVNWFGDHQAITTAIITMGCSFAGTAYKHYVNQKEYDDYLYVTTNDDEIARIPARTMKSVKSKSWRCKKNPN